MIDRTRPLLPITGRWTGGAALVSVCLFLVIPAVALLVWLLGWAGFVLAWSVILLVYAVVYALFLGGLLGILGGLGIMTNPKKKEEGCGFMIMGWIAAGVGGWCSQRWAPGAWGLDGLAAWSAGRGAVWGSDCIVHGWVGYGIYLWSWLPLAGALCGTLGTLAVLGVLRGHDRLLGPIWRTYLACPHGHRAGVAFACPGCGAWEPRLVPSIYGLLSAPCACGRTLPTSQLAGRSQLRKRCGTCAGPLEHPDLGRRAEYHVAVWGSAESEKSAWLSTALQRSVAAGARLIGPPNGGAPNPTDGLPARVVSLAGASRHLLYLYDIPDDECLSVEEPARRDYLRWIDAVALVLSLSPREPDGPKSPTHLAQERVVTALLDRWDRMHVGRTRAYHRAPVAVILRWQDPPNDGAHAATAQATRGALERAGFGPLVLALQARFRVVDFFTFPAPSASTRPADGRPEQPLEWLDRVL